jgi:leucyl-tRNA synthetase
LARTHALFFTDGQSRELPAGPGTHEQRRLLHRTIRDVTERIERMAFNTAISALMVFARDIQKEGPLTREEGCQFCLLLSPFAPHLAEEIWHGLGHERSLAYEVWPKADPAFLAEEQWTLVVQINGKKRDVLELPLSVDRNDRAAIEARARESETIRRHLEGKQPRKVIVVPGKLVNIVV